MKWWEPPEGVSLAFNKESEKENRYEEDVVPGACVAM